MKDLSRDGNQIFVGECVTDGVVGVICVINGKCITFDKGLFDFDNSDDVKELLDTAACIGLDTEDSRLAYPMIYGVKNTFVDLYPSVYRLGLKGASVGEIDGLPDGFAEKVRLLMDEYESI